MNTLSSVQKPTPSAARSNRLAQPARSKFSGALLSGVALLATALLATSCGVFGLDKEEADKLALFQSTAQRYIEGQRWDQALGEVRRGFEIDADDYKLHYLGGWCYLRQTGRDPENLDRAQRLYDRLEPMRDLEDHHPAALLGMGQTQQQLGRRHRNKASLLDRETLANAGTEPSTELSTGPSAEHRARAEDHWQEANRIFGILIEREELLRYARRHRMEIALDRDDYALAVKEGVAYLERSDTEKAGHEDIVANSPDASEELRHRDLLRELLEEEKRVRMALAEAHYLEKAFQKAIVQLDRLLTLDPTNASNYYNRARAWEALDNDESARRDYQRFLSATTLPPGDSRVLHAVEFTQSD